MAKKKHLDPNALYQLAVTHARKLTATERRRVLVFLADARYDKSPTPEGTWVPSFADHRSNYQLGALFGVSEAAIRADKKRIQQALGEQISPTQAVAFVTESFKVLDRLVRAAEQGLDATEPGTQGHREYIRTLSDLESKRLKTAQEIGLVQKELGRLQVTEEHWIAETAEDGTTTVFEAGSPGHEPTDVAADPAS